MKLLRSGPDNFQFALSREEKALLLQMLRLYPLVPAAHHQLSKGRRLPNREENQRLLDESLQAQRQENRRQIESLLNEPKRFTENAAGCQAGFTRGEIEWLLQVFNDVRVGSWLALGSPTKPPEIHPSMNKLDVQNILAMDVAGYFEMALLRALTDGPDSGDD